MYAALLKTFSGFVLFSLLTFAQAQTRTEVIVPYAPGGVLDAAARIVAHTLQEYTSETYVVKNLPGANGLIGVKAAAKSIPDGSTWLLVDSTSLTVNAILAPKDPAFDAERDLKVVAAIAFQPSVLVVRADASGPKSIKEFLEINKNREFAYGSGGVGSVAHLTMEYFASLAGLKVQHVAYKGGGPAMNDLMGGQIHAAFVVVPVALPHIKSGRLLPLAISSRQRVGQLPDVPTAIESGFQDFEVQAVNFMLIPARTPTNISSAIEDRLQRLLADPAALERIRGIGTEPAVKMSAVEASNWLSRERDKWSKLVLKSGIKSK